MKRVKSKIGIGWDTFSMRLAYRVIPARLLMHCFLKVISFYDGEKQMDQVTVVEIMDSFKRSNPLPDYRFL